MKSETPEYDPETGVDVTSDIPLEDNLPAEQPSSLVEAKKSEATERIQAMLVIAKRFPRNQTEALRKIRESCRRITLADQALYSYPRAGKKVTGPSIRLAEVLSQNWGNMESGIVELERHPGIDGYSVVEAYAWDLESNTRRSMTFTVPHKVQLKDGRSKYLTDPRDIYEIMANHGARRERRCILGVIPGDVTEFAVKECRETMKKGDGTPLVDRVNQMVLAFADLGVSQEMLEQRLGHEAKLTTADEIVDLKAVYLSMKDGQSRREDWFKFDSSEGGKADEVNKRFRKKEEKNPGDGEEKK